MRGTLRDDVVENGAGERGTTSIGVQWVIPYNIRLPPKIAHWHLVGAMMRRGLRVSALHLMDAALIGLVMLALSATWTGFGTLRELIPALIVIHLLSLHTFSIYRESEGRGGKELLAAVVLAHLAFFVLAVFPPYLPLDVTVLVISGTATYAALAGGRRVLGLAVRQAHERGVGLRRALLVGDLDQVGKAIEKLRHQNSSDHYIVGHVTPSGVADPTALGGLRDLVTIIEAEHVQEVIVSSVLPQSTLQEVATGCFQRGAALFVIPPVPDVLGYRAEPLRVGMCTLLRLHPARLELPALLVKRVFDLIAAALAVILLAPLMAVVAAAIKLDSPGPVFFRQRRVGLAGRTFTIWKFRSMYSDSEGRREELTRMNRYGDCRLFKVENDPRITRVGRLLRRTSLDELPQLFNVLLGDMSLVGPRPPLPSEVAMYEPHHFERLTVMPGITGPWQVGGRNLITDFEKVVRMERAYIESWSLLLDAKILCKTIKVVVSGEGAY
jgi:exopolysaccharide biosynthesis polyprenyl glycosylphosphotransferase